MVQKMPREEMEVSGRIFWYKAAGTSLFHLLSAESERILGGANTLLATNEGI